LRASGARTHDAGVESLATEHARTEAALPPIPVFDLKFDADDLEAVAETLRSGWLTLGPKTAAFEEAYADHLGAKYAIAVSSCTSALHLAYLAAGVGPGDEVIVPSFTFVATAAAVRYTGATPVFADILGYENPSLDPADIERKLTERTKAVCLVHFGGYAARVDEVAELCERRGVTLIEDCAHVPSASLRGKKLGTFGLAGAFSFFSNKVLAVGEGGVVVTDDDDVAEFARSRRSHSMTAGTWQKHTKHSAGYDVDGLGFNYRIDEPRSALLLSRLSKLGRDIERRQELTRRYRDGLRGVDRISIPFRDEDVAESCCYVMALFVDDPEHRDPFRRALLDRHAIQTSVFYPSIHRFTAYRELAGEASLPRTELASGTEVTLPLFAHMSDDQVDRVVEAIRAEVQQ
jgi:dTDP-4-amino-4,6-dideoxygalactose transaminase